MKDTNVDFARTPKGNASFVVLVASIGVLVSMAASVLIAVHTGLLATTPVAVTLLGFSSASIVPLLALIKVLQLGEATEAQNKLTGERLTELIAARETISLAAGKAAGEDRIRAESLKNAAVLVTLELHIKEDLLAQIAKQQAELEYLRSLVSVAQVTPMVPPTSS